MEDRRPSTRVWAALEQYNTKRDRDTHFIDPVMPDELGIIHAFSARDTTSREAEFFDGAGPWAVCGTHVKVRMPVSFTPDEDDACPRCAELVARGVTRNGRPRLPRRDCADVVMPALEGVDQAVICIRDDHHDRPHRSADGHTWWHGAEDFTPNWWDG